MHIFLDESGDLGFDFSNKKPSKVFVITLLVCRNLPSTLPFKRAVKRTLRNKLNNRVKNKKLQSEIKGINTPLNIKKYFFHSLKPQNNVEDCWEIHSIILNKQDLLRKIKKPLQKNRLYNILSRQILEQIDFNNVSSTIQLTVDKSKNKKETQIFNDYLQYNLESLLPIDVILNIRHEMSHNNFGLQAVDMFCWGIARKYELNDMKWYGIFCKKVINEHLYQHKKMTAPEVR